MRHRSPLMFGLILSAVLGLAHAGAAQSAPSPKLVEDPTNTAVGQNALAANTTGSANTASGAEALFSNTIGFANTANGYQALFSNTDGVANTATGSSALYQNTFGNANSAHGDSALYSNTTGQENVASGASALFGNTTGNFSTGTGVLSLYSNTTGADNTAAGHVALLTNTIGVGNTASGAAALYNNDAGSANTADGAFALFNATGFNNTAVGHNAGSAASTGNYNVYLGSQVTGGVADTNTIRIGLPNGSLGAGTGQNQTFIAGIHGTQLSGSAVQVFVDANGQLGTLTPPIASGTGTTPAPLALERQVHEQLAINAELRQRSRAQQAMIEDLLARLARLETASRGSRRPRAQ